MKIAFLDFWDNFNPYNNFFIHSFKTIWTEIEISSPEDSDMIIYSCFGNSHFKYTGKKYKVFFTGENKRPDYSQCNKAISFDIDSNNNMRIPLWYLYIDWFNVKTYDNPNYLIPVSYIDKPNEFTKNKTKFCSSVFSNPVSNRINFINKLNSYKKVDSFGKCNEFKLQDGEKYKLDTISDYKFNICFENSFSYGYYTEKILHAKVAGCIPIYESDSNYIIDFNKDCCLFNNENIIEQIIQIDNNDYLYNQKLQQPLFNKLNIDGIFDKLSKNLNYK